MRIVILSIFAGLTAFSLFAQAPAVSVPLASPPAPASPSVALDSVFRPEKLAGLDAVIEQAIQEKRCPGAVLWVEHGGAVYHKAFGQRALEPEVEAMSEDTVFDAASLTKVLSTTGCIMALVERGQLEIDAPASRYLPEFTGSGKEAITLRHLLTHTSGLRSGLASRSGETGREAVLAQACAEPLPNAPGTIFRYSDINFIVLGEIVRRVSGQPLEKFAAETLYRPLGMRDTGYLPAAELRPRIAPTERVGDGTILRGTVHDPTARRMGGVAGHAGLFTTATDVARYARMMLGEGTLDGVQIFKPETVRLMTTVQTPPAVKQRRGLGWDIDSPYAGPRGARFPIGSYGHTGWTGGSLWIDPFSKTFVIFLTNRNHPDGKGNVVPVWGRLGTLAADAVIGYNFAHVDGALPPMDW